MILVACITFGHEGSDIAQALGSAVELAKRRSDIRVVAIDDSSGAPPSPQRGVTVTETPRRVGFPAAVNHLVSHVAPEAERLVLINPDASLDVSALERLVDSTADIEIPVVSGEDGVVENLRYATTAGVQLRALLLGEGAATRRTLTTVVAPTTVTCPPYAPQGAVISVNAHLLRETPLEPEMFWLEFSDWIYRRAAEGRPVELALSAQYVEHTGASTSVKYPLSVAASQVRAKAAFVERYGTRAQRAALPVALAARALRFGWFRRSPSAGWFVFRAGLARANWRVSA